MKKLQNSFKKGNGSAAGGWNNYGEMVAMVVFASKVHTAASMVEAVRTTRNELMA